MVLKIKQTTHYDYYCSAVFVKCPTVTMMRNSTINNAYLICNIACDYYEAMILVGGILLGAFKHIWDDDDDDYDGGGDDDDDDYYDDDPNWLMFWEWFEATDGSHQMVSCAFHPLTINLHG